MKAHALEGRDKPKDAYDIVYCLGNFPEGLEKLAAAWKQRSEEMDVKRAIEILRDKFTSVEDFGPTQVVEFFDSPDKNIMIVADQAVYSYTRKLANEFTSCKPMQPVF